jgi:hypothetical protein
MKIMGRVIIDFTNNCTLSPSAWRGLWSMGIQYGPIASRTGRKICRPCAKRVGN